MGVYTLGAVAFRANAERVLRGVSRDVQEQPTYDKKQFMGWAKVSNSYLLMRWICLILAC